MLRLTSLVLLLVCGCMQPPVAPAPSPPVVAPATQGEFAMALEADASTIATLFKYGGSHNAISISDSLSLQFGATGIYLPAGTSFSYDLTATGGTISFGRPKPVIATKVAGITVHPVLDRIVLRSPDQAVAYATDLFGIEHSKVLDLPKFGSAQKEEVEPTPGTTESSEFLKPLCTKPMPPKDAIAPERPRVPRRSLPSGKQVYVWTNDDIVGKQIETELSSNENLDFIFNEGKPFSDQRPAVEWTQSGRTYRQLGWSGLDHFLKDSQEFWTLPAPKASTSSVPATSPPRHVAGTHSHKCPKCGKVWSHTAASRGSRPDHTCPVCGTVQWEILQ